MSSPFPFDHQQQRALQARIGTFATPDVRRGQEYFRQKRVKQIQVLKAGNESIGFQAKVQGTRQYTATWRYNGEFWDDNCTCPLGSECKHTYAAALAVLRSENEDGTRMANGAKPATSPLGDQAENPEISRLVELLEQRLHRTLASKQRAFVRELVLCWTRVRDGASIYPRDLHALGLGEHGYYFSDPKPILGSWRDAAAASKTPLEFWQFLALYLERTKRPIPEVMRPVTDTSRVREIAEASDRQHEIMRWRARFEALESNELPMVTEPVPFEVRLRFATPKLVWESRASPDAPWQTAKSARVHGWFEAIAIRPGAISPASLALLQEVQLRRTKSEIWNTTDAQTLRVTEASTREFLRWMLDHPVLRHLLIDSAGEPFATEPVTLRWLGRAVDGKAGDIAFDLVDAEGREAPRDLLEIGGVPPLGLSGRTIYHLPPPLAEGAPRGVIVPREALAGRAKLRLHRQGVKIEGVELPPIEEVKMSGQIVCSVRDEERSSGELLEAEVRAVSPDSSVSYQWQGSRWTKLRGPALADETLKDFVFTAADPASVLPLEIGANWNPEKNVFTRRALTKSFPEEFSAWAQKVQASGVELICDETLAGLARAPDLARLDVRAESLDEGRGIDWFDLQIAVRAEDHTLTDEEVKLLLKARGRFVRLADKGWRRLKVQIESDESERLAELGVDVAELNAPVEHQRFHALQLADERIAGLLPEAHAARIRERADSLKTFAPPPIPPTLRAELRPYQRDGYHFLAHLSANGLGGVLADDMGLGKTIQALTWLLWLKQLAIEQKRPWRVLVVCPKSVVPNWEREAQRFAPSLTVAMLGSRLALPAEANLIVANYAQLRLAATLLTPVTWDALILDEGQNIKNPQSQTAKVARELRATHRVVLTGTPIENRTLDLWSLFAFAMPGLLGSQAAFKRNFNDRTDPLARSRLARRVRHFMLRRTKAQVAADLPPRIEEDLFVDLDGTQRKLYDAELKRARSMLLGMQTSRDFDQQRFNILQSLLRLRQICCDPRLLAGEAAVKRSAEKVGPRKEGSVLAPSAKVEALFDTIEPLIEEGHRVLVFSQFVSMLELISAELRARNIAHLMLTGQTENRQELVDRFQSEAGEPVFLLSLKAAGTGLNLTAASYVVLFDPWWNPAVEAQAIDRTHRIGQKNQVIAYRLLARDSIEEKIRLLQQSKAELARTVVQEENVATVMSIEDLRFVLGE